MFICVRDTHDEEESVSYTTRRPKNRARRRRLNWCKETSTDEEKLFSNCWRPPSPAAIAAIIGPEGGGWLATRPSPELAGTSRAV
jgi:16S rRNA U1498 N3-methylase RsmE